MTEQSSAFSDQPFEDYPGLMGILLKTLSAGLDAEHDAGVIKSFAEHFHVPPGYVTTRMRVYILYDASRAIH